MSDTKKRRCGCWRIAAVKRPTIDLSKVPSEQTPLTEIAYYVCSKTKAEMDDTALLEAIVGHWAAIENGAHWVRDVTFGEDCCRVARPKAARNFVTLRNLAIGLYNLLKHRERTGAPSLPSWQRSMSNPQALRHVLG
ncbi:MAG TPA: hypothetical protein VMN36_19790 [Verrucomicrobiales bacterium]|nr:hypothetical protein [Verrucomicrobiales bacterium]